MDAASATLTTKMVDTCSITDIIEVYDSPATSLVPAVYMTAFSFVPAPATVVYVDGFNLYYGALKGTPHRWLDLDGLFRRLRPGDDIQQIRYCSAMVVGPTRPNQEVYLKALATTPKVEVSLGKFKEKQVRCGVSACTFSGSRFYTTQEEKRTDVNIAVAMIDDANRGVCEKVILVSGDSDLVPAVTLVRSRHPSIEITVYVPANHRRRAFATELRGAAHKHRDLPLRLLPLSQFPDPITLRDGSLLSKPADWAVLTGTTPS
ncbi:MAG: hypothetical protein C0504_18940 [Candidatus Solibacter sp.]|nr:hypothetical protein [Candidatus Solibacter sp.]